MAVDKILQDGDGFSESMMDVLREFFSDKDIRLRTRVYNVLNHIKLEFLADECKSMELPLTAAVFRCFNQRWYHLVLSRDGKSREEFLEGIKNMSWAKLKSASHTSLSIEGDSKQKLKD